MPVIAQDEIFTHQTKCDYCGSRVRPDQNPPEIQKHLSYCPLCYSLLLLSVLSRGLQVKMCILNILLNLNDSLIEP